jgi:hypothetical protein
VEPVVAAAADGGDDGRYPSNKRIFYRKLSKCGHLEDKTFLVVSLILSLL